MTQKPRLVITGPTGIGKTAVVNLLLSRLPLDVINLDSIQVYAFFRVGPGREDATHAAQRHLYGYLSPHDTLDPAAYARNAAAVADEIELYGRVPIFEGASRSLFPALASALPLQVFGLRPPDDRAWRAERLRARVDKMFERDRFPREVRKALALGYGECRLMRDPLLYLQVRDYLDGKWTLEACKRAMVESLLEMQDAQLNFLEALPGVTWMEVGADTPAIVCRWVERWLESHGWLSGVNAEQG